MVGEAERDRIKRASVAVRRSFVEKEGDRKSPLGSLLSSTASSGGGRGGRLRVALLMTLLWVIASGDFTSIRVSRYWSSVLGMPDPDGLGARAVLDTLHELEARGFVGLEETRNGSLKITLLEETGSGRAYTFPDPKTTNPVREFAGERKDSYFRIPRSLWDSGMIQNMSGRALAMYLIVLSLAGYDNRQFWINATLFNERYGLGETTRKRGMKELVDLGVLDVAFVSRSAPGDATGRSFRRNVYEIHPAFSLHSERKDEASLERKYAGLAEQNFEDLIKKLGLHPLHQPSAEQKNLATEGE